MVVLDFESTGACEATRICLGRSESSFSSWPCLAGTSLVMNLRVPESHPFNPYAPGDGRQSGRNWRSRRLCWSYGRSCRRGFWGALAAHHAPTERSLLRQTFAFHDFPDWSIPRFSAGSLPSGKAINSVILERLGLLEKLAKPARGAKRMTRFRCGRLRLSTRAHLKSARMAGNAPGRPDGTWNQPKQRINYALISPLGTVH